MDASLPGSPDGSARSPTALPATVVEIGGVAALEAAPKGVVPLPKAAVSPVSSSPVGSGEVLTRLFFPKAEGVGPSKGRHGFGGRLNLHTFQKCLVVLELFVHDFGMDRLGTEILGLGLADGIFTCRGEWC